MVAAGWISDNGAMSLTAATNPGPHANIVIRASAGTGKTFRLSNRYLKLLIGGVECQEILATTFTKKGAGEILDRIIRRLSQAALSAEQAGRLSAELEVPLDQQQAKMVLQRILQSLHQLEIGTLDSFFNRVARVFSLELGLPPTWDIVEEQQIDLLRRRTIRELLRNKDVVTLLPLMNKGESGRKIASLVMRVVKDLYATRRESEPAAWDRLEELDTFLPKEIIEQLKVTAANLPPDKKERKNVAREWAKLLPLLEAENWQAIASLNSFGYAATGTPAIGRSKFDPGHAEVMLKLVPHVRAWITRQLIENNRATCRLLGLYGESLEQTKSSLGQLRFEDVTERLVAFIKMWDTDQFSFRLDNQIQHLLLDEFQDTSTRQWSVVKPFAEKVCEGGQDSRSFFCVGDMKQAIFGWRGGVAEIFDLVEGLEGLDEAQPMTKSYRSSPVIIDAVNEVFEKLDQFKSNNEVATSAVHSWQQWFQVHSTARESLKGHFTMEYAADFGDGTVDRHVRARKRNENVRIATVERVRKLATSLPDHQSIGVLVRTNREVGELIFLLQQAGVHASEEGGNALTDSAAVNVVLSALQLADHPGDGCARFHVSHSRLAERMGLSPETSDNQSENKRAVMGGAAKLREDLIHSGYGATVESLARILAPDCTGRELTRLQHLVRIAYGSRSDRLRWSTRPGRFVEYIRDEFKIADQTSARVRVMTIHKSKGLEFDVVVFPHENKNNEWIESFPSVIVGRPSPVAPIETVCRYINQHQRKLLPQWLQDIFDEGQRRTVRESLCVLYVAMTRAVHSLHVVLSYSDKPKDNSSAGILLSSMMPGMDSKKDRRAGVIYERGDPQWYENPGAETVDAADADQLPDLSGYYLPSRADESYRPLSRETKTLRGIDRIRPSYLEGGSRVKLSETLISPDRERMLEFGSLLHVCFEQVRWLDDGSERERLSRTGLMAILRQRLPGSSQVNAAVDRFYELVKLPNLQRLLSIGLAQEKFLPGKGRQLEVLNEQRLAVILDRDDSVQAGVRSIIEGTVDRLVLVREGAKVVAAEVTDFKIDSIGDDNLTERIQFYRPQLTAYREAVMKMYSLADDQISTQLVFVHSGHVVQLDFVDNRVSSETDVKPGKAAASLTRTDGEPAATKPPQGANRKAAKPAKPKPSTRQKMLWSDDEDASIG